MKKLIVLVFVITAMFGSGYAQPGQGGQRMNREQRNEMMAQRLGLDENQKEKFTEINERYREKTIGFREKMRSASDSERQELFAEMREIRTEQNNEIREILNDDQKQTFDEILKEMQVRWQNRGDRRGGNPRNGAVRPGK